MKTPFEIIGDSMNFIHESTKKTFKKGPVQFDAKCPKCGKTGKVYPENHKLTFHCYTCGYQKFWDQVATELAEIKHLEDKDNEDFKAFIKAREDAGIKPEPIDPDKFREMTEEEYSEHYPMGGSLERYDMWRDDRMN